MKRSLVVGFALLCGAVLPAQAQLKDENLLVTLPSGFKVDFQDSRNGVRLQEWVPSNETVRDWTEMVSVQVFMNRGKVDPAKVVTDMTERWGKACKGGSGEPVTTGKVNGYGFAMTLLRCPLNGQTGKPETTLVRAIAGNDSLYMVQRAARFVPGAEQLQRMRTYLATVSVCDTRTPAHPCPDLKPIGR